MFVYCCVDVAVSNVSPHNSVGKPDAEQPERVVVVDRLCVSWQAGHAARLHAALFCADCSRRLCQCHTSSGPKYYSTVATFPRKSLKCFGTGTLIPWNTVAAQALGWTLQRNFLQNGAHSQNGTFWSLFACNCNCNCGFSNASPTLDWWCITLSYD